MPADAFLSRSTESSCPAPLDSDPARTTTLDEKLPLPTLPRPFSTKKSHARKQPIGHIPRPRNAFILFRCDYGRQNQQSTKEWDQNDISRTVGKIWRSMSEEQRAPWVLLAESEKKRHAMLYPGYKYTPRKRGPLPTEKEVVRQIEREAERAVEAQAKRTAAEKKMGTVTVYYPPWATRRSQTYYARRATSCPPPGAVGIDLYSEMVDRTAVAVHEPARKLKVEQEKKVPMKRANTRRPRSTPTADTFVPSVYAVDSCPADSPESWRVTPDRSLSERAHNIDPPGGTRNWGEAPLSPTEYRSSLSTQYSFQISKLSPPFYTDPGELTTAALHSRSISYANTDGSSNAFRNYQPQNDGGESSDIPSLPPPSPAESDSSASPSPATPTEYSASTATFTTPSPTGEVQRYNEKSSTQIASYTCGEGSLRGDFASEFGVMYQDSQLSYDYGVDKAYNTKINTLARESSVRTTYAAQYANSRGVSQQ